MNSGAIQTLVGWLLIAAMVAVAILFPLQTVAVAAVIWFVRTVTK